MHKFAVVIGRFQPCHAGHIYMLQQALSVAENLIILVGSSFRARTIKNPFTYHERKEMIIASIGKTNNKNIHVCPIEDQMYNEQDWIDSVNAAVNNITDSSKDIVLVGHDKDESSYYLKHFSNWQTISINNYHNISATPIRNEYFQAEISKRHLENLPKPSIDMLKEFTSTNEFKRLQAEFFSIQDYQLKNPQHVVMVELYTIITCKQHVLLCKRQQQPGKGLLTLPGGLADQTKWLKIDMVDKLISTTNIKLAKTGMLKSIANTQVFDHPNRSQLDRIIAYIGYIDLKQDNLPIVTGDTKPYWQKLNELDSIKEVMYDDHFYILRHFSNGHHQVLQPF